VWDKQLGVTAIIAIAITVILLIVCFSNGDLELMARLKFFGNEIEINIKKETIKFPNLIVSS